MDDRPEAVPGHSSGARSHDQILKKVRITVYCIFSHAPTVETSVPNPDAHSSPKVHAAGSTMRSASASRVTEMSNGHMIIPKSSREAGRYVDNVTVGNGGAQRVALDRLVETRLLRLRHHEFGSMIVSGLPALPHDLCKIRRKMTSVVRASLMLPRSQRTPFVCLPGMVPFRTNKFASSLTDSSVKDP